jgi:hypothetical protein
MAPDAGTFFGLVHARVVSNVPGNSLGKALKMWKDGRQKSQMKPGTRTNDSCSDDIMLCNALPGVPKLRML